MYKNTLCLCALFYAHTKAQLGMWMRACAYVKGECGRNDNIFHGRKIVIIWQRHTYFPNEGAWHTFKRHHHHRRRHHYWNVYILWPRIIKFSSSSGVKWNIRRKQKKYKNCVQRQHVNEQIRINPENWTVNKSRLKYHTITHCILIRFSALCKAWKIACNFFYRNLEFLVWNSVGVLHVAVDQCTRVCTWNWWNEHYT